MPSVLYSMNNMHGLLCICHSTVCHVKRGRRQYLESSDLDGPLKAWSRRWRIFHRRDAVVGVPRRGLHANGFRLGRSVELGSGSDNGPTYPTCPARLLRDLSVRMEIRLTGSHSLYNILIYPTNMPRGDKSQASQNRNPS